MNAAKKIRVVSGIQPSGRLHIGNYLGALKNFVALQESKKYDPFFFVADLHSLTEPPYGAKEKMRLALDLMASYLAVGLNPKKSTLFIQSKISAHTELSWILASLSPMGELERMTQFKEKASATDASAGLFTYPVLMAADILIYDARFVPVGSDQDQHLELARTLARKFNARFGKTFLEPRGLHTEVTRLMSLDAPNQKMSKSRPAGCLFLDDDAETITKKIMSAVTDSDKNIAFSPKAKAGISNLLLITSSFSGYSIKQLESKFKSKSYVELKKHTARVVDRALGPIRKKRAKLLKNPSSIINAFTRGNKIAQKIANKKLEEVKSRTGLL